MKTSPRRATLLRRRFRSAAPRPSVRREMVTRCDLADCLLQAYEFVARRAYEKFLLRGAEPGGELEDWLSAERELLLPITVDIEESAGYVRALATAPGFSAAEIGVGIEPRWLAIIGGRDAFDDAHPAQVFSIHQLPAEVDPARATVIYSEGILGIRMAKAGAEKR